MLILNFLETFIPYGEGSKSLALCNFFLLLTSYFHFFTCSRLLPLTPSPLPPSLRLPLTPSPLLIAHYSPLTSHCSPLIAHLSLHLPFSPSRLRPLTPSPPHPITTQPPHHKQKSARGIVSESPERSEDLQQIARPRNFGDTPKFIQYKYVKKASGVRNEL